MASALAPIDLWQRRLGAAVLLSIVLLLFALGGRLVYINTHMSPQLALMAQRQRQGRSVIPSRRGMILDARRRVVAVSRQMPDVFIDPAQADDLPSLVAALAPRINRTPEDILTEIARRPDSRFIVVATRVDEVTADAVRALGSPAVGLRDHSVRCYPLSSSMAHVVGIVGRDAHGLEGLELAYDDHLSGVDGTRMTIRDARRRALRRADRGGTLPVDGGHVVLTIDAEIQRITEEALATQVTEFEAESGVAIVMSPSDGRILAMANVPSFDPNDVGRTTPSLRRNRAVTDPTEPGSTFKPIIACGALDGGFVNVVEEINCHMGTYRIGRRLITDTSPRDKLNLLGIITKSSNIGMSQIAERMGNEVLHATIRRFGFGEPTGVSFPGESGGLVWPLDRWTTLSTASVSFGYEIGVTPLQLINAFAAIINDGVLLQPRLVGALLEPDGSVAVAYDKPIVVRRVASTETARYMAKEAMVSVVEHGGGRRAKAGPYRVLGKTGTAKLPYRDRKGYEPGAYLSTFVGAAPVEAPQVVALVMIRRPNPNISYYGGAVAAPAVGAILQHTLAYLGVPPGNVAGSGHVHNPALTGM